MPAERGQRLAVAAHQPLPAPALVAPGGIRAPVHDGLSECFANAALPGYIVGATDWLDSIWSERAAFADKPALILWGLKDIAFPTKELERWKSELSDVEAHELGIADTFWLKRHPNSCCWRCMPS
ncbi:MAG: hypothetical protein OXC19_21945 [Bryobacterales bacterium]|nr:hypothetical protein [Bryobacterales bacterium]